MLVAAILLVLAFGFVAGTRSRELYAIVGPLLGQKISAATLDLSSVQSTYQMLKANYNGKLDDTKLIEGASRGLAAAVGDKYTVYMNAKEAKEFGNELSGNIGGGVGAEVGMRNKLPTVLRVLDGNPAQRAGLHAGDSVVAVNETSTIGLDADRTVALIRGEIGTTVKITVHRGSETKQFAMTREEITNPSVVSKVQDGIGILTLNRFDSETVNLSRQAAESFKMRGVRGVLLDLRGNGGGYLEAAQGVAGLWLDNQKVVSVRSVGSSTELTSEGDPILKGIKTVVLVDAGSASASEIVSGALQDYGVATLVGETTFGKGTVQEIFPLANDAEIKITIKRWYTPKGKNITSHGIKPNKNVVLTQKDLDSGRDPQLEAGVALLR